MPTIIATAGAVDANSYATLAEADSYFTDERLFATTWTSAVQATKEKALIWATKLLDYSIEWFGAKRTIEQALRWPRSGLLDLDGNNIDYDTIPKIIKDATCELAMALILKDRTLEPKLLGQGFSQAAASSVSVTVDSAQVLALIPRQVFMLIAHLGEISGNVAGGGARVVQLSRR